MFDNIWDNPEGCLDAATLKVGDVLQVKSIERLVVVFGEDHVLNVREDIDYLVGPKLSPYQCMTVSSVEVNVKKDPSVSWGPPNEFFDIVKFKETGEEEYWFNSLGENYPIHNITFNEIFELVKE